MQRLAWTLCALLLGVSAWALDSEDFNPPSREKLDAWFATVVQGVNFDEAFDRLKTTWPRQSRSTEELLKKKESVDAAAMIRLNRLNDAIRCQPLVQKLTIQLRTAESIEYEIEAQLEFGGQKFTNYGRGAFPKDRSKFRLESTSIQNGLKRRIFYVCDGKKAYREHSVLDGEGKATSLHVESTDFADVAKLQHIPRNELLAEVDRTTKGFDFYAISEEFLGPKSVDVLKGVERGARSLPVEKATTTLRLTLRPKDSLLLRSEEKGPQGSHDIQYKNVKINEPIDDALFVYTPPEGALIKDNSASGKVPPK